MLLRSDAYTFAAHRQNGCLVLVSNDTGEHYCSEAGGFANSRHIGGWQRIITLMSAKDTQCVRKVQCHPP